MNTADRQLLQQALDALENSVDLVREDAYNAEKLYGNYPSRQGKVNGLKVLADDHEKAITALQKRLAHCDRCGKRLGGEGDIHTCTPDPIGDAQDRLIAEMAAQPEQEPVGDEWTPCMKLPVVVHVRKQRPGESYVSTREGITPVKPDDLIMRGVLGEEYPIGRAIFEQTYSLDTTPPAAQHQCKWPTCQSEEYQQALAEQINQELVTGAAQRPWVELTDEEIDEAARYCVKSGQSVNAAIGAAEAKLKEKNT